MLSVLNAVERDGAFMEPSGGNRWQMERPRKMVSVRRGSYHSVRDLIQPIDQFVATYNQHAQPFVSTKTTSELVAKANPITTSEAED